MSEPVVFTFPLPLNVANARLHHMAKHRAKVAYWQVLDMGVMGRRIPRPPARPWPRIRLDVEMRPVREMDHDNAEARLKWSLDWLTSRGYLAGDTPRHIERTGLIRQTKITSRQDASVVLTVTPLEVAA